MKLWSVCKVAFLLISVIIANAVAFFIKKKLTKVEMYATAFFAFSLAIVTDITLDLKMNLYGYFNTGLDVQGFIPLAGLYPATNLIFLNLYPVGKRARYIFFYYCIWNIFALVYEWAALKSGFFYHNGW